MLGKPHTLLGWVLSLWLLGLESVVGWWVAGYWAARFWSHVLLAVVVMAVLDVAIAVARQPSEEQVRRGRRRHQWDSLRQPWER